MRKRHRKAFKGGLEFLQAMMPTKVHSLSALVSINGQTVEASYRPGGWKLLDGSSSTRNIADPDMTWAVETNLRTKKGPDLRIGGLGTDPLQAYLRCVETAVCLKYGDELRKNQYVLEE